MKHNTFSNAISQYRGRSFHNFYPRLESDIELLRRNVTTSEDLSINRKSRRMVLEKWVHTECNVSARGEIHLTFPGHQDYQGMQPHSPTVQTIQNSQSNLEEWQNSPYQTPTNSHTCCYTKFRCSNLFSRTEFMPRETMNLSFLRYLQEMFEIFLK